MVLVVNNAIARIVQAWRQERIAWKEGMQRSSSHPHVVVVASVRRTILEILYCSASAIFRMSITNHVRMVLVDDELSSAGTVIGVESNHVT